MLIWLCKELQTVKLKEQGDISQQSVPTQVSSYFCRFFEIMVHVISYLQRISYLLASLNCVVSSDILSQKQKTKLSIQAS